MKMLTRLALCASSLAYFGCVSELDLPIGSQVTCNTDSECIEGWRCSPTLQRCVQDGSDTVAPGVSEGSLEVAPELAPAGASVTISFRVTEELATPPTVRVRAGNGFEADALLVSEDATEYIYSFTTTALEQVSEEAVNRLSIEPEGALSLGIELIDTSGNVGIADAPRSFVLDRTPPTLISETVAVQVLASPASLVTDVAEASAGSSVRVFFAVSESLAVAPTVIAMAEDDASELVLLLESQVGTFYTYALPLPAEQGPYTQGGYTFIAAVEDLAGNGRSQALAGLNEMGAVVQARFVADTIAPVEPDVHGAGRIVFRRRPWGHNASAGIPEFAVEGQPGAVESGAQIFVFDRPEVAPSPVLLGTTTADADGAFGVDNSFLLTTADRVEVYITAVDGAGNASPWVQVRDGEWVASLTGKQPENTFDNPHRLRQSIRDEPLLEPSASTSLSAEEYSRLGAVDTEVLEITSREVLVALPEEVPENPTGIGVAFDSRRGVLVRAEAIGDGTALYEFDGRTWTRYAPLISPPGVTDIVFDARRGRIVSPGASLVGGELTRIEVWEWTGQDWLNIPYEGESPPVRAEPAMTYDASRGGAVIYGGWINALEGECSPGSTLNDDGTFCIFGDMWVWDGTRWTEIETSGVPPENRSAAALGPDGLGGLVLAEGCEFFSIFCPEPRLDAWYLDANNTWMALPSLGESRAYGSITPGSEPGRVVLSGGSNRNTYEFDGVQWNSLPSLPSDVRYRTAFDVARQELVAVSYEFSLFGAPDCPDDPLACGQVEVLSGDQWQTISSGSEAIPARSNGRFIALGAQDRGLFFGGWESVGLIGRNYIEGTYLLEGGSWAACTTCSNEPRPRWLHSMAFDTDRGVLVLFGGNNNSYLSDTWEFDGSDWTQVCGASLPCSSGPSGRGAAALAYDAAGKRVVLFGGGTGTDGRVGRDDTWEYGEFGASDCGMATRCWREIVPIGEAPSRRFGAAMTYDSIRERIVLFGGGHEQGSSCDGEDPPLLVCPYNDTWTLEGESWSRLILDVDSDDLEARRNATLFFDEVRDRAVLVGGDGGESQIYELAGDRWLTSAIEPASPFTGASTGHGFMANRRELVSFQNISTLRTFLTSTTENLRPSMTFDVQWSASQVDTQFIQGSQFFVHASGRGATLTSGSGGQAPLGDVIYGIELQGWSLGSQRWETLIATTRDTAERFDESVELSQSESIDLFTPFDDAMHFRVRPAEPSGNGEEPASVAVDYVEVTVQYRLPD